MSDFISPKLICQSFLFSCILCSGFWWLRWKWGCWVWRIKPWLSNRREPESGSQKRRDWQRRCHVCPWCQRSCWWHGTGDHYGSTIQISSNTQGKHFCELILCVCVCVCVCVVCGVCVVCEFVKWPEVFNLVILNGLLCWRRRMSGHPWFCSFRTGRMCQSVCLYCHRIDRLQLRLEITHHVLSWYHWGQPHISFRGNQWQKLTFFLIKGEKIAPWGFSMFIKGIFFSNHIKTQHVV